MHGRAAGSEAKPRCRAGMQGDIRTSEVFLIIITILLLSAGQPHDQMNDPADDQENHEEDQEPADAVDDIVKLHDAGTGEALADFDREGDHQNHGQNVQKRNDHGVSGLRQPEEQGMKHKNQCDPQKADDDEVQFLVREAAFSLIVESQEISVDARNHPDDIVKERFHNVSPYPYPAKAGQCRSAFFCNSITGVCDGMKKK